MFIFKISTLERSFFFKVNLKKKLCDWQNNLNFSKIARECKNSSQVMHTVIFAKFWIREEKKFFLYILEIRYKIDEKLAMYFNSKDKIII